MPPFPLQIKGSVLIDMKLFRHADKRLVSSGIIVFVTAVLAFCLFSNFNAAISAVKAFIAFFAPVYWGLIIAYLMRPFANLISRLLPKKIKSERVRTNTGNVLAILLFVLLVVFVLYAFLPQMLSSLIDFASNFDGYVESFKGTVKNFSAKITFVEIEPEEIDRFIGTSDELLYRLGGWAKDNINTLVSMATQVSGFVVNFLITITMAIYALIDRKNLKHGLKRLLDAFLSKEKAQRTRTVIKRGDSILMTFLSSNLVDSLIIGGVNFVFLGIAKADYQLILAFLLGLTNYIPTFGPIIGGVAAGVVILLTKPHLLLAFFIFTVILQQIDGNIIKPLLFGDSMKLSPFWVMVAIIVGGRMFGLAGMILGTPIVAFISSMVNEAVDRRLPDSPKPEEKKRKRFFARKANK